MTTMITPTNAMIVTMPIMPIKPIKPIMPIKSIKPIKKKPPPVSISRQGEAFFHSFNNQRMASIQHTKAARQAFQLMAISLEAYEAVSSRYDSSGADDA